MACSHNYLVTLHPLVGEVQQMDVESHLIPECDSGLGQSIGHSPSGRLSALSQHSDPSTVISIPHGRYTEPS